MGLDWKHWYINVKLTTFGALQGKFSNSLPDQVMLIIINYGFNFIHRHPLRLWKAHKDWKWHFWKFGPRPEFIGPKYYWVKVFFGPKYAWVKVVLDPNCVSAWQAPRPPGPPPMSPRLCQPWFIMDHYFSHFFTIASTKREFFYQTMKRKPDAS